MCKSNTNQRGGAKMSLLLTLCVLGSMIFVGVKVFPPFFSNYQLQDSMQSEATFAMANRKSAEDIRADVWRKVQELGIPVKQDAIVIKDQQGAVSISIDYSIPIDLLVYQFNMQFHPTADNHSI